MSNDFEFDVTAPKDETLPPEGVAMVQLTGVSRGTSKAGNDMFIWDFAIKHYQSPDKADLDTAPMRLKSLFTALSAAAAWKLDETLQALGVDTGGNGSIKGKFNPREVVGTLCLAEIKHDEYNGSTSAVINGLSAHPDKAGTKAPIESAADPFAVPF